MLAPNKSPNCHTQKTQNKTMQLHTQPHTHEVAFRVVESEVTCSHMRERHMTCGEDLHLREIKV